MYAGSWRGLIDKLDYIHGMGFSAVWPGDTGRLFPKYSYWSKVWISPVTNQEQKVTADLSSYHGYWQTDLYRLNSAFGTTGDLKALSDAS